MLSPLGCQWCVTERDRERYTFPAGYILAPGATVRLHPAPGRGTGSGQGGTDAPPSDLYWTTKNVRNNDGETVYLWDARGQQAVHETQVAS